VVDSLLTTNTQVNHARNRAARHSREQNLLRSDHRAGLESLDRRRTCRTRRHDHPTGAVHRLIDDYKLLMTATIAVLPLLVVFKKASGAGVPDHSVVME
jgi:hypothetical protein